MYLESSLRWLLVLRIVAVTTLLFAALIIQVATDVILPIDYLYYLTAGTYGASLLYILLRQSLHRPRLEAAVQLGGDLLIVTALVYFTGIDSGFSFLYLIVIATAAALLYRRGALMTASAAGILYGVMFDLMVLGIIPTPGLPTGPMLGPVPPTRWAPGKVYYNIFINLLGFYGVALLTSYLAEKLRSAREELERRRGEFEELQTFATEVVSSLASGLITVDGNRRITFVNPAGWNLLGGGDATWSTRDIAETGLFDRVSFESLRAEADAGRAAVFATSTGESSGGRALAGTVTRLSDVSGQGAGYIVLFEDVTSLRDLEAQVRLKDRMAAVGEMAAGIAHEIRNPLASIAGSVQVLGQESGLTEDGNALVRIVLKESSRLNRIIEDFLRFVRPPERRASRFDVAGHLAETVRLLRNSREIGPAHRIRLHLTPESFEIVADPDQVRQVLWNVATNGLRAMPHGGDLVLEGSPSGGYYSIVVRDTGVGMTEEERARLFQPFKTRFDGGSGLGMAIVYRIIEDHGGRVRVESAPDRGTTVRIDLPVDGRPGEPTVAAADA